MGRYNETLLSDIIFYDINRISVLVASPQEPFEKEQYEKTVNARSARSSLGGMLANMCVESHMRELLEQGFEVAVAKDATAAPKHPEWGYGYEAALISRLRR